MLPDRPAHHRDRTDRVIQAASWLGALAMFAYGACLSFDVLHHIARACGLSPRLAWAWPLGFEAFMAVAAVAVLAEQRARPGRTPVYPWTLTALAAGSSIALNFAHPFIPLDPPPRLLVACVYGVPPVTAPFAWHLFLLRLAHRRHPHPGQDTQDAEQEGQDARGAAGRDTQDRGQDPAETSSPPAGLAPVTVDAAGVLTGTGQDIEPSRATVRVLLATETPHAPVSWQDVTTRTGLSRSRAYALLREERARLAARNGQHPPAMLRPHPDQEAP
ncbi:MAG TPA: DUF2637 domain-containing protein [Actinomycetes bacterium]|nr:DUF2637 domain-containing protein [Actinomycetes bacterium]